MYCYFEQIKCWTRRGLFKPRYYCNFKILVVSYSIVMLFITTMGVIEPKALLLSNSKLLNINGRRGGGSGLFNPSHKSLLFYMMMIEGSKVQSNLGLEKKSHGNQTG